MINGPLLTNMEGKPLKTDDFLVFPEHFIITPKLFKFCCTNTHYCVPVIKKVYVFAIFDRFVWPSVC